MGKLFGSKLRQWRESKGISGNKLAEMSGIPQGTLNGIEHGRRRASDRNLEAIASVSEMDITSARLSAWRAADQIGLIGLQLICREAPELLEEVKSCGNSSFN